MEAGRSHIGVPLSWAALDVVHQKPLAANSLQAMAIQIQGVIMKVECYNTVSVM